MLEGLESTEIRLSQAREEGRSVRLDAEFFQKAILRAVQLIKEKRHTRIRAMVASVLHPVEIEREYQSEGIRILLAQNVRDNILDLSTEVFMSLGAREALAKNRLVQGDVVMTRSGANYGQCASWRGDKAEVFACADVLVFRGCGLPNGFLSTFFGTQYGRLLLQRGAYGMAQPHIAPAYLRELAVPRFDALEAEVDGVVGAAYEKLSRAGELYASAERTLLEELALSEWRPPEPLTYVRHAADAMAAGRMDAEYFRPRYMALLEKLRTAGAVRLGDCLVCRLLNRLSQNAGYSILVGEPRHRSSEWQRDA